MKKRNLFLGATAVVLVGGLTCSAYFLGRQSVAAPVLPGVSDPVVSTSQPAAPPVASKSEEAPAPEAAPEAASEVDMEAMFPAESVAPPEAPAAPLVSQSAPPIRATSISVIPAGPQDIPDGVISFDAGYAGNGSPVRPDPPASGNSGANHKAVPDADGDSDWETDVGSEPEDSSSYDLESFAAEVLRLTNEARAKAGANALETDPVLTEMAQARMDEKNGSLSHTRPDGTTPDTIFAEYDTALTCTGEIIMSTASSPQAVIDGFLSGAAHRRNMLNPDHKYVGIGVEWGETPAGPGIAVLELFAK